MVNVLELDIFSFVEGCEPDCSKERHAYHQGQWDMALRIEGLQEFLPQAQKKKVAEARHHAAITLISAGYSYRQTMRALGLKSPRSVEYLVKKTKENGCEVKDCNLHQPAPNTK